MYYGCNYGEKLLTNPLLRSYIRPAILWRYLCSFIPSKLAKKGYNYPLSNAWWSCTKNLGKWICKCWALVRPLSVIMHHLFWFSLFRSDRDINLDYMYSRFDYIRNRLGGHIVQPVYRQVRINFDKTAGFQIVSMHLRISGSGSHYDITIAWNTLCCIRQRGFGKFFTKYLCFFSMSNYAHEFILKKSTMCTIKPSSDVRKWEIRHKKLKCMSVCMNRLRI